MSSVVADRCRGLVRASLLVAAWLVFVGCSVAAVHAAQLEPLEIVTKSGVQVFSVELAKTDKETYWREIERIVAGQFFGQQAEVRGGED